MANTDMDAEYSPHDRAGPTADEPFQSPDFQAMDRRLRVTRCARNGEPFGSSYITTTPAPVIPGFEQVATTPPPVTGVAAMDPWVPGEINEFVDAVEYAMQAPLTDAFVRHVVTGTQAEIDADLRK